MDYGKVNTYLGGLNRTIEKISAVSSWLVQKLLTEHLIISSDFFRHKNALRYLPYNFDISWIQPSLLIYIFVEFFSINIFNSFPYFVFAPPFFAEPFAFGINDSQNSKYAFVCSVANETHASSNPWEDSRQDFQTLSGSIPFSPDDL